MAAAEVLLAYEPLQHLKHENFLLREENGRMQSDIRELLIWKDKAVTHMAAMAPARQRASREFERAKQLQQKLCAVERSLKSRTALEQATTELEVARDALQLRVQGLERELVGLKSQSERRKRRAEQAESQLAALAESFRLHLERLIAIRESFGDVDDKDSKNEGVQHGADSAISMGNTSSDVVNINLGNQEQVALEAEEDIHPTSSDSLNSAALVAGLTTVASKCTWWLEEHLKHSFAHLQRKAARYETEHKEVKRLNKLLQDASCKSEEAADQYAKQTCELGELRGAYKQSQQRAIHAENEIGVQQQLKEDMVIRLQFIASEVRQYLRLVRGEIKRKFGYLPEAIAHAESWATIAEALELLLLNQKD